MQKSILSLDGVKKTFAQGVSRITVLNGINATFEQGSTYAITGASGSGKSTLLHSMAGLDDIDHGSVSINDRPLMSLHEHERSVLSSQMFGVVFQQPFLIREMTVLENVMLKGLVAGQDWNACTQEALRMLQAVGLAEKAYVYPATLSGGQQQRVAILRALFNKPSFLLADEPTGSLDIATGTEVIDFMLTCQREWGMGLIVCSHDDYVVERMQTVLRLERGVLV